MSLITLPVEVLESILLYVDAIDLLNVCEVVHLDESDSFWKKVCLREGYKKILGENGWKIVFQRNINWISKNYIRHEYNIEDSSLSDFIDEFSSTLNNFKSFSSTVAVHKNNLVVNTNNNEVAIWKVDGFRESGERLPGNFMKISGSKLLTNCDSKITIYSLEDITYHELFSLTSKVSFPICDLTDNFFVGYVRDAGFIIVVDLAKLQEFNVSLPWKNLRLFSIILSDRFLNILCASISSYILKRFNLESKLWMDDLELFGGAALIHVPKVRISSHLIVSWSDLFEDSGTTPVKVWSSAGEAITRLSQPDPDVLWMTVVEKYVIFSTSNTSITVWHSSYPDDYKNISKSEKFYYGQTVISNSLLVLAYAYGFKIIDFKKATYLYEVLFPHTTEINLWSAPLFFVNEYFYVHFRKEANELSSSSEQENEMHISTNSKRNISPNENQITVRKAKNYFICVFDFQGKSNSQCTGVKL